MEPAEDSAGFFVFGFWCRFYKKMVFAPFYVFFLLGIGSKFVEISILSQLGGEIWRRF